MQMENDNKKEKCRIGDTEQASLPDLVRQLFEEFEYLGISEGKSKNVPDHLHLILNTFKLINLHRKTIAQINDIKIERAQLKNENANLQKQIEALKKQQDENKIQCNELRKKYVLSKLACENCTIEKERLKKRLEHLHKSDVAKKEILHTETQTYDASNNESIWKYIMKFKENEEIYKETIRKLEENNRGLLNEILVLKEEITALFFNKQE